MPNLAQLKPAERRLKREIGVYEKVLVRHDAQLSKLVDEERTAVRS